MPHHAHHMKPGVMAMAFFVGSCLHLGDMSMHRPIGKHDFNIHAARSPVTVGLQFQITQAGDEICLPHMVTLPHRDEVALTFKKLSRTDTLCKVKIILENKIHIMKSVEKQRQIGGGGQQSSLLAG